MLNNIPNSYNIHGLFLCLKNSILPTALKLTAGVNELNMCAKRQKMSALLVSVHVFLSVC